MVRSGALSDASIKAQYPEMFPLDLGMQQAMFAPSLHLPKFNKPSKKVKHATDYARFPIYDIKNFAKLATPQNGIEAGFEGILSYREKIGSQNIPSNIMSGYENQKNDAYNMRVYQPMPTLTREESLKVSVMNTNSMSTPASLSLGQNVRRQGITEFNRRFKQESIYLNPETKALLMNLGDDRTISRIIEQNFTPPLKGAKIKHSEALATLRKRYSDSPENMEILSRAERAARVQGKLPDRSNFNNLILDPFGRFRAETEDEEFERLVDESAEDEGESLLNPDDRF
jgi:hypothetical protein